VRDAVANKPIEFHPVTSDRWADLDRLFSASAGEELGNPSRCWCMEWRRPHEAWEREAGEGNRHAMQAFIDGGEVPGILAYLDGEPAGWCSVSPRNSLSRLIAEGGFRSPDRSDVWSIICFYVPETRRGQGMMKGLVCAAVDYAVEHGAKVVEAYPNRPEIIDDGAAGSFRIFEQAGFVEVARPNPIQVTMRYVPGDR